MTISKELQEFLDDEENQKLLNNNKFEELYKELNSYISIEHVLEFTQILYEANIDPLKYMDYVPYCFMYCNEKLTSFVIPNNIISIDNDAFYNCSNLVNITIPNSVISIGSNAFYNCSKLTIVTIPNSVTSIHSHVFEYCDSLTSITIGNSVENIGDSAFEFCDSLTSVEIPNSVTDIGNNAFYNCSSLQKVTISNSVISVGDNAFDSCSSLTDINFNGTKAEWRHISKGKYWHYNSSISVIHCIDGDIGVEQNVIYVK